MKRRYFRPPALAAAVFCFLILTGCQARAATQAELSAALKKIDMKLYKQCEADVRAWLDARMAIYGDFGVYPDLLGHARVEGDRAHFNLSRGGICDAGAQFFRAYEMLGDKKYLAQALKTADVLLAMQQRNGHFAGAGNVDRKGRVSVVGDRNYARIQDGSQFRPFAYILYAYRVTGEQKYLDAARRCADLFVNHIQDPKYGWCGDAYNAGALRRHKHYESDGGSYNDFATTDPMRMTIMMYHVTKDKKYLKRTAKIGQWMFVTQLGKGKVRGWCQQYKADNTPASARGFEGAVIGPRTFNRFISPMLTWFYGMTGEERYRKLLQESYTWLKAQEHPDDHPRGGGWAYQYLPDGSEIFTHGGKIYRYDKPKTWPKDSPSWVGKYHRSKVQVTGTEKALAQLKAGGLKALRKWYSGPKKYSPKEYLEVRLAAARRCSDENLVVPLRGKSLAEGQNGSVKGKYLACVRRRLARPDAPGLPKEGTLHGRKGLDRQSWHSIHTWNEPYRPPYGWAQWQYVWDVRLATGKIDADTAVTGGRGLEAMHYWPRWDVLGDWTARAVEVEDWMNVPLAGSRERRIPLSKATSAWGYYGVPPESPDGKRLCYAVYPKAIDLARKERYPVYPAELWVCNRDGGGHRMLYRGRGAVHNGLGQSWVDNTRIVFASEGATRIVNADTGKAQFGPFAGFSPAHFAMAGKVLMHHTDPKSAKKRGLYELDTATGKMRLVLPYTKSISHVQYSPDGRKALFTTNGNTNLAVVNLDGTGLKVLPDKKPMHFQWFDNRTLFGYVHKGVVGVDLDKHHVHELYRWNLEGKIIEHLAGHGCHGAARADRKYFVGESWYHSKRISLRLYARARREPLTTIFSHSFFRVTWLDGGRHHVNPSFSRDGARVYYNKAVSENTSQAFCYDLTGLVEPIK